MEDNSASTRDFSKSERRRPGKLRRWVIAGVILVIGLGAAALFAPNIIAATSLRNDVLARAFPNWKGSVNCRSASFGWLSPIAIDGIEIREPDGDIAVAVSRLAGKETLWQIVFGDDDLGEFRIVKPVVHVVLRDDQLNLAPLAKRPKPKRKISVVLAVEDASIDLRGDNPEELWTRVDKFSVQAQLLSSDDGRRTVVVSPATLLDHTAVTPQFADEILKYIAPVFTNTAWAQGELSLSLEECQVRLDAPQTSIVKGKLSLHTVELGTKDPTLLRLTAAARQFVNRKIKPQVRLAKESIVDFELKDGRVSHQNLAFGLPDVSDRLVVRTRGSVGLDETLDLVADVPLPVDMLGDHPILKRVGSKPLTVPIKGTFSDPQIELVKPGETPEDLVQGIVTNVFGEDSKTADLTRIITEVSKEARSEKDLKGKLTEGAKELGRGLLDQAFKELTDAAAPKNDDANAKADARKKESSKQETKEKKRPLKTFLRGLIDAADSYTPPKSPDQDPAKESKEGDAP